MRTFVIAVFLSVICSVMAFSQTPMPGAGSGRRPVLTDDIRRHPLYQTDAIKGWEQIPNLDKSQQKKISEINCKAKKKLAGISEKLSKKIGELQILMKQNPTDNKAIKKKEKEIEEIEKLADKSDSIILDARKKVRKLLDTDQKVFFDSLDS